VSAGLSYRNLSLNVPLAAGAELLPGLAAGLALTLRYGLLDAELEKQRTGDTFEYLQRFQQETAGAAASLDAGLLWRLGARASIGAVWRLPYSIVKTGETSVDQSLAGLSLERGTRVKESIPSRAAIGAAWRPGARDLLAVNAVWMDWSAYRRTTTYDEPVAGVLENSGGNPADWQDTWVLSAGWEHLLGRGWSSRLGFVHDQAPEPRSQRTLVGGQVVDAWKVAVGLGWAASRATVDLGYTYSWNSGDAGYLPGAEYQLSFHEVYVGVSWRF
jgi:long-subunit fatty acid transport protein